MTAYKITANHSSGYTLMSGDTLTVSSGGYDTGSTIGNGAIEFVLSGGVASGDTVSNGGLGVISPGGAVSAVTVKRGGVISGMGVVQGGNVYGLISGVTVEGDTNNGANRPILTIQSGGVADNVVATSGLLEGGVRADVLVVLSGATASGLMAYAGVSVYSGAVISNATIEVGGTLVGAGAQDQEGVPVAALYGYNVNSGVVIGVQVAGTLVEDGTGVGGDNAPYSYNIGVESGGLYVLNTAAAELTISKGGVVSGSGTVTFSDDGNAELSTDYGVISGVTLGAGIFEVESGGFAGGVTAGGYLDVDSGASVSGITVSGGLYMGDSSEPGGVAHIDGLMLSSGAMASDTIVVGAPSGGDFDGQGGLITDSGGLLLGLTTNAGTISAGRIAGTDRIVGSGGVVVPVQAQSGTNPNADDYATLFGDFGDTVLSGGFEVVANAQTGSSQYAATFSVTVNAGGVLSGPGAVFGGSIFGSAADLQITEVTASQTDDGAGSQPLSTRYDGSLDIMSGGVGSGITVSGLDSAGMNAHQGLFVSAGGRAVKTAVDGAGFLEAMSGGVVSATVLSSGGVLQLDSHGRSVGLTVQSGGLISGAGTISGTSTDYGTVSGVGIAGVLTVESGAVNSGTTLLGGGEEILLSGAAVAGDVIVSGGLEIVSAGAQSLNVVISAGGVLSNAGYVNVNTVTVATLYGTAIGVGVTSSGFLDVLSGGVASSTVVSALYRNDVTQGQGVIVSSGGSAVKTLVASGGLLDLEGGSATATMVQVGGVLYANGDLLLGATTNAGVISSAEVAGTVTVSAAGLEDGDTVLSGGAERVLAGGSAGDFTVSAGGVVSGAGLVVGSAANGGNGRNIDYGLVSGLVITSAAGLEVGSGGVASGVTVSALFRNDAVFDQGLYVGSGGSAVATRIASGGLMQLSGGSATDTTVQAGGVLYGSGGVLAGATVNAGVISGGVVAGVVTISSSGVDNGDTVLSGSVERVLAGGSAGNVVVSKGGVLSGAGFLFGLNANGSGRNNDYGLVSGLTLSSAGADLEVESGGVASGVTVSALYRNDVSQGQGLYIYTGGVAVGTKLQSGGLGTLQGGVASGTTVAGGGVFLLSGGTISGAVVQAGGEVSGYAQAQGVVTVSSGGSLLGLTFQSGATDVLYAGATEGAVSLLSGATLELVGATISAGAPVTDGRVHGSAAISGTTLSGGAVVTTLSATVLAGGVLAVSSGATAAATTVSSGGVERLISGAIVSGATVLAGGVLSGVGSLRGVIADQGLVSSGTVNGGGVLDVLSGGALARTTVVGGSTISAGGGAILTNVVENAGGMLIDNGAATYTASTRLAGTLQGSGSITVAANTLTLAGDASLFRGALTLSGGTADLDNASGLGGGPIAFVDGAGTRRLRVEAAATPPSGSTFADTLTGFDAYSDQIDLRGVSFTSGATAILNGNVLTLSDGGYIERFKLAGAKAASYVAVSDGSAGGTLIRAVKGSADALVQAVSTFDVNQVGVVQTTQPQSPQTAGLVGGFHHALNQHHAG